jgi:hypothetical protein
LPQKNSREDPFELMLGSLIIALHREREQNLKRDDILQANDQSQFWRSFKPRNRGDYFPPQTISEKGGLRKQFRNDIFSESIPTPVFVLAESI